MSLPKHLLVDEAVKPQSEDFSKLKWGRVKRIPRGSVLTKVIIQEKRILKKETLYVAYLDFVFYNEGETNDLVNTTYLNRFNLRVIISN